MISGSDGRTSTPRSSGATPETATAPQPATLVPLPAPAAGCAPQGQGPAGFPSPRFLDGAAAARAATRVNRTDGRSADTHHDGGRLTAFDGPPTGDRSRLSRADGSTRHSQRALAYARQATYAGALRLARRMRGSLPGADYRAWLRDNALRTRSEVVDEFGLDPVHAERWRPLLEFLYRRYWRVETEGIDNVPDHGRVMIVANRSGPIPYDALMLIYGLRYDHPAHRTARPLLEDTTIHIPYLGPVLNRLGCVRACQENAERLLGEDNLVVAFPEGQKGSGKLRRERYKLQRFGRGGFVRLAIRTQSPIIPAAVIGAEEVHPMLGKFHPGAQLLGLPFLPITATFPWLGPLGMIPLPRRWYLLFGTAIATDGFSPEQENDRILVNELAQAVRSSISQLLADGLAREERR